jgi:GAF domain-containing protein
MVMLNIKSFFSPPVFESEEKNYIARLLNIILLSLLAVSVPAIINGLLSNDTNVLIGVPVADVIVLVSFWLLHRGYLRVLGYLIPLMMLGLITYLIYNGDGLNDVGILGYGSVIALASLLLSKRAPFIFALLSIAALAWVTYAQVSGIIVTRFNTFVSYHDFINASILLVILTVLLWVMIANLTSNLERARRQEKDLTESNLKLQAIQATLAEQVVARTQGLELVATLGERLSAILDVDQLLFELVNQVKNSFGYYHVQVYLLDDQRQKLIMAAGSGEIGQRIKMQGYSINLDAPASLIAQAARTNQVISAENVRETIAWLPNPFLEATQSEMALPIVLEGQVVGVLDVQEDEVAGLDEGDANVLRSLANQVAVAIRNARLFARVETALAEAEAAQERYLQQAWEAARDRQQEYHYHRPGAQTIDEATKIELDQAAQRLNEPTLIVSNNQGQTAQEIPVLVAPIKLQNQVIGNMQFLETDPSRRRKWTERELALVQAIADQVAQTAENLRLFDETRGRASREQVIREITDKLRAQPSLGLLLETAARELGNRLGVQHTILEMGIENNIPKSGPSSSRQPDAN